MAEKKDNFLSDETEEFIIRLFQESLENSKSVPDALEMFSRILSETSSVPDDIAVSLGNGVNAYKALIQNRRYLSALRTTFNSVYDFILPKDITFKIEGRRKGCVNSIEKMLKLLKEGRSLDLFRDSMGIRIVLFGKETEDLQHSLYSVANELISFMLSKKFILCEADKVAKKFSLNDGISDVIIPKESGLKRIYQTGCKDYILYPKANGYQSLHLVFRARNGSFLEIQLRTEEMHIRSEHLSADHAEYKKAKYSKRLHSRLDFSKIQMPGFRYLDSHGLYDEIGLQQSLLMFFRTKSF